ncbi:MAG: hypothetical protein RI995_797 [Bacteroidota bacterium]
MNNFIKLFSTFLITTIFSVSVLANDVAETSAIPAPAVSINNYPNGAVYFIRNNDKTVITPIGCSNTDPITWTYRKFESNSPVDPFDIKPDRNWSEAPFTPETNVVGGTTYQTTLGYQGTPVDSKFQSVEYKLTCTSVATSAVVTKSVTLVTSLNDQFNPKQANSQPIYRNCGNPATGTGYGISFEVGRTFNNALTFKKPNDAGFSNSMNTSGAGYSYIELGDGDVQDGKYSFRYQFHKYFDGTSEVDGTFSTTLDLYVQRKTGSPVANYGITQGLLFNVNGTTGLGAATVCLADQVKLYWNRWDEFYNNTEYSNNYDFVWKKDIGVGYVEIGKNTNNFNIANGDISGTYRLEFVAKGNSAGCLNPGYIQSSYFALAPVTVPTPSIVGQSQVCPDGSIVLSVDKTSSMFGFTWTNDSNTSLGTSESLTVTSAGKYSVTFKDSNLKNSLGDACASPVASKTITSFDKPVQPSITSSGKTEYCDYATIKDVLTASITGQSAWMWSSTATKTGSADASKYTAVDFGSYKVKYQDANGCWSNESNAFVIAPIARPATPTIKLTGNAYNCEKDAAGNINTVKFDLTSAAISGTYQWYLGAASVQNSAVSSLSNVATSGTYTLEQTDAKTGCTSLKSAGITVNFQKNPTFANASIAKMAYTLTASNFEDNTLAVKDYVWKVGAAAQANTTAIQKVTTTSSSEYSVARYVAYTLNGSTIQCLSNTIKYSYVPDPEFSGIIVYPNPATSAVKIDVVDTSIWNGAAVNVYDMVGRLVYSSTLTANASTGSSSFDLKALGNGIYILNLNATSGNSFQTKLVINK